MAKFDGVARIAPITANQIETEYVASGLDWWRKSKGVVSANDRHLDRLFSRIQICANSAGIWPPRFMYVGSESDIVKFYGPKFCETAPGQQGVPDQAYENATNGGYFEAATSEEAIINHVTARTKGYAGHTFWAEYQRAILPGSLPNGRPVLLTFSKLVRLFRDVNATQKLPSGSHCSPV